MGCFSTCFRKSKRRRSRRSTKLTPCFNQLIQVDEPVQPTDVKEQENAEILINPSLESSDEQKENNNLSGRKKVTFDLNVRVYEELPDPDENDGDLLAERSYEKEEIQEEDMKPSKEKEKNCASDSSSSSSLISFPSKAYRYQDCGDSDDEFDDLVSDDDSDHDYMGDDEEDDEAENELNNAVQEESESTDELLISGFIVAANPTQMNDGKTTGLNEEESESTDESLISGFKIATNPCQLKDEKTADLNEEESESTDESLNSGFIVATSPNQVNDEKTRDVFDSVLHPVENLRQWKAVKARSKLEPQNKAKENFKLSDEANLGKSKNSSSQEIGVDTSLSSWLAVPEVVTPTKSKTSSVSVGNSNPLFSERTCSPKDFEDRPILGALTVEEIRQFSANSTPRRSPSLSPDDMPIIGSVGSYWSPTDQNSRTRSKYSEVRKVKSNSSKIPFEKRLEKAASSLQKKGVVKP